MNAQDVAGVTAPSPCPCRGPSLDRVTREIVVRRLKTADLPDLEAHLLALDSADRQSRFHAFQRDDAIHDYVSAIDFQRMILVGAFDFETGRLIGLAEAHLDAATSPLRAETSVSVLASHRGRGIGRLLTTVALDAAAARGTRRADFYYQAGNRAIAGLVRNLGVPVATAPGFASFALPLESPVLH